MKSIKINNGEIIKATAEDIPGIRAIWEECFTTDTNYLNNLFKHLFPLIEGYIYKEDREILSTIFLIPITLLSPNTVPLLGQYLYGVATTEKGRGKKLSIKIVEYISEILKSRGNNFIITRPATPTLFDFYKKQGFTIEVPRGEFSLPKTIQTKIKQGEINKNTPSLLSEYIQKTYPKRFEWDENLLNYMIYTGEFTPYLEESLPNHTLTNIQTLEQTSTPNVTPNVTQNTSQYLNKTNQTPLFALLKPLQSTFNPLLAKDAFFNFPME